MNIFKPIFIEGRDIDDTWFKLLQSLYQKGRPGIKNAGSGEGMVFYTLDFISGFIHYPHSRPLAPIMPEGIPPVTTDEQIEKYFTNYLMNNNLKKNEHYKYSTWIIGGVGKTEYVSCNINQVDWIIKHFKTHGYNNNHCYLVVGNPETSYEYNRPYKECPNCKQLFKKTYKICQNCNEKLIINESKRPTSPCLRGLDFRIIDGILLTNVIYRAWNVFAWPENIGGFTLLNEFISDQLENIKPGPISFTCKSLNCPEDTFDILKIRLNIK